jgi:hypothetical protein
MEAYSTLNSIAYSPAKGKRFFKKWAKNGAERVNFLPQKRREPHFSHTVGGLFKILEAIAKKSQKS